MNQSTEVRNIDLDIEVAKKSIELQAALKRLQKNPDFKLLIEEAYLKDEASNVVIAKALPHLRADDKQKVFDQRIIAIGEFRQWLSEVFAEGEMAQRALAEAEQTRDEIEAEEG